MLSSVELNLGLRALGSRVLHSHVFLTELTWQVLIEGYLTSLLLLQQLTFWTYLK